MTLVQRLLLLVGATVTILVGTWLYEAVLFHNAQEEAIDNEVERTLSLVSMEYSAFIERAQSIVSVATVEAPDAAADGSKCQALISSLHTDGLPWLRLDMLDSRGIVRCSTDPQAFGSDLSDYPEVMAVRAESDSQVGNYSWDLFSGTPSLVIARLWKRSSGTTGVVAAVAQLHPLVTALPKLLPNGYGVILADRAGRILATGPGGQDIIGRALPLPLEPLTRMAEAGRTHSQWIDGSERIIAYSPADTPPHQGVFIAVGISPDAAMVGGLSIPLASGLLIAALAAMVLAWWGGVHFIRRPLGELAAVALRWRDGDQTARVALPGRSEIAALGRVFNAMADAKDRSDQQMREGTELLTALVESSRDAIFVFDRDGCLLVANATFLELAGLAREAAIGRQLVMVHDPDLRRTVDRLRQRVVATRVPQAADLRLQSPDGEQHVLQTICAPIFGERGEVGAVAGIGRDITEARKAAENLRQARNRAEAADRAKTRFLAAASHDLRQPLQAAVILSDLVARKIGTGADAAKSAENLRRALDDLKRLVEGLFDVSRLDSGSVRLEVAVFPLQPLLDQISVTYIEQAKRKGVVLSVCCTDAVVRSDRILLGRLLSNLIDNAVKYTQVGSVTVECQSEHDLLQIRVEDTGVGISQEDLSRIWLEFEQLHNQQRDRRQGLGLGLAIVRRLSALLEHPVEVHSDPGKGSLFSVSVPVAEASAETAASRSASEEAGLGKTGRVVIIDDDPMVLDVLRMMLEEHAWEVVAALDTIDAVKQLAAIGWVPDLAVADYRLGDGHVGTDAIVAVRQAIGRELPAIILTGELAEAGDESDPLLRDARRTQVSILRKPIRSRELITTINSVIAASTASGSPDVELR
jgi:two-component system, sensor histidine kinase